MPGITAIQRKGSIPACTGDEVPTALTFGTAAVSAQEYVVGSAIAALTFPAASGGAQPVTYSLSPALPVGLGFNRSTRVLSGIPLVAAAARAYTYTATDADGNTVSLTFTIAVGPAPPAMLSFGTATVSAQEYGVGSAIAALTLPAASGGAQPVTYSLSPALPVGMGFNRSTRMLSGIPLVAAAARTYTYTATDADGDTAVLTFTIAVASVPSPIPTDRDALIVLYHATGGATWTRNTNWLSDRPLREWHGVSTDASGRVTLLSLPNNNLRGELPPEFGNLTRLRSLFLYNNPELSGPLPAEMVHIQDLSSFFAFGTGLTLPSSLVDWYATIATSSTLPAHQDDGISFGAQTISGRCYTEGVPRSEIVLPAATGGVGPLSYTLTPALPPGLSFDSASRTLSGTLGRQGWTVRTQPYFYTASDAAGESAELSFTITFVEGSEDRETLVAFYNATSGPNWGGGSNWLSHCVPISQWRGVSTVIDDRRVTSLALPAVGLTGAIPLQIGDLEALEILDLSSNRLTGAIPPALGRLSRLTELDLRGNSLAGAIPGALGNLASLETMNLSDNRLTGSLPAALGGLASLQRMTLSENPLAGALPKLSRFPRPAFLPQCPQYGLLGRPPGITGELALEHVLHVGNQSLPARGHGELVSYD